MTHQDYKNIIIVGASIGGHTLVNQLYPGLPADYRILLVEALEFAFYPIAAFRAATVPGWENKITVPLTHDRVFPAGSQHQVLAPNKLMECKASSVVLQHPFEGSTEVPFWRCVIATGATQQQPMVPDLSSTEEEYKTHLRQNQKELREVRDVVIIGGGAVGIEFAGDIRCINSKTNITIIHPRSGLLEPTPLDPIPASTTTVPSYSSPPVDPRFSQTLEGHCLKLDISLIFQDRVVIPEPKDVDSADEGEWKGEYGKQHGTKEVSSTNDGSIFNGQYYAIGDVCNAPGFKAARGAFVGAFSAAANIKAEIKGKSLTKFSPGLQGLGIPVGHDEGAIMVTLPWIGNWVFGSTLIGLQRGKTLVR
ncbi:hypothetical protein B9479_001651 [Cryptococcus floricola]|uniref:FAD/NAD(P)-binding domain-containing protein n=1 Tax=Cryptococcus floricola TaxID=2591691 RepID=A0A5D3B4L9_9TREE|nr:hypothetical protein B9479_001651 [Cryptococcus floricola]